MKQQKTDSIINWISQNIFGVFIAFIILLLLLPFVFTLQSPIGFIDSTKANEIGDAINGLTAPIIGSFSALLVYLAFKAQIDANNQNRKKIEFENLLILLESTLKTRDFLVIKNQKVTNIDFLLTISRKTISLNSGEIEWLDKSDTPSTDLVKTYLSREVVDNYNRNLEHMNRFLSMVNKSMTDDELKRFLFSHFQPLTEITIESQLLPFSDNDLKEFSENFEKLKKAHKNFQTKFNNHFKRYSS